MMIFLHSSFRVSSTWIWSRFRSTNNVVAYYEVFHDMLASITRTQLTSWGPDSWHSRHPPGVGYFLEYLPLVRDEGGVVGFDEAMSYRRFIPSCGIRGTISEREHVYITSLMDHASALKKTPILSDSRSLGRFRALKAAFPGMHVLVYRNMFEQWCSYTEQSVLGNNPHFLDSIRWTISENLHDPFFRYLHDLFPLDEPDAASTDYFCCFVLLHLYLYGEIVDVADLIVDVNRLAKCGDYRQTVEQQIAEATGVTIDLSSIRNGITFALIPPEKTEDALEQIKIIANIVIANASSPRGKAFASQVLEDFVTEFRQYQFYAGRLVGVVGGNGLLAERNRLRVERDDLLSERDDLQSERDDLQSERDDLQSERDDLQSERDELRSERDRMQMSRSWRLTAPMRAVRRVFG